MEQKKQTNGQLQRRLKNALVHIDKTSETKSVYFDDKGLRVTVNEDVAIVETGYHRHIFNSYTMGGVSAPWLFLRRLVDITLENECNTYQGLSDKLKEKKGEASSDYNFVIYVGWWLYNIFIPLYHIGNDDASMFIVYEDYIHNMARNTVILSEREEDLTNKKFVMQIEKMMNDFMANITETVFLKKKTDEEIMSENIAAEQAQAVEDFVQQQVENEKATEAQINGVK